MKAKCILTALALPAVFMACTNDDLLTEKTSVEGVKGELVELEDNFTLGVNRDNNDAGTRAAWENTGKRLKFFWYPTENGGWTAASVDKVGLCWYGTDGNQTYATSNGEVYTNYQFNHFGWKLLGTDYDSSNNQTYAAIGSATAATEVKLGDGSTVATQADYTLENYSTNSSNTGKWDGSLGLFKTENKSIFKGEYIVYTPYQEIKNIGHIPASVAAIQQQSNTIKDSLTNVGAYTVSYGKASVEGGVETSGLSMRNLTSVVRISVSNETGSTLNLKKVILLDKQGKGFYTKKYLSATKIFANPAADDVYQDALFAGEEAVATNSISVNFVSAIDNSADGTAANLPIAADEKATACLVTLPTTIADMAVVLVDENGKAKIVDVKNFVIGRGQSPKQAISIKKADEFDTSIVTSESEWTTAIAANTAKIVVLGEVPIAAVQNLTSIDKQITVSYIGKESGLVFNGSFTMGSNDKTLSFDCVTAFNAGITVSAGTLSLNNSMIEGTVAVSDSLVIAGKATYQNGTMTTSGDASVVSIAGSLDILGENDPKTAGQIQLEKGTFVIAADGELTNLGTIVNKAQFTNNGTVNNDAAFYNQNKLTNNSETGFINNADFYDQIGSQFNAYSTVSGAGNYFCDVQSDASNNRLGVAVGILDAQTNQSKKIIRFTDATGTVSYDLKDVTNDIDVIVASGATVTLQNSNTTAKFIKSLTVNTGTATIDKGEKFNMNSLEIAKNATATFGNNSITYVKSPVVNNGTFTITAADTGQLAGIVYCPAPVDSSKGTWTGFVTYKSNINF